MLPQNTCREFLIEKRIKLNLIETDTNDFFPLSNSFISICKKLSKICRQKFLPPIIFKIALEGETLGSNFTALNSRSTDLQSFVKTDGKRYSVQRQSASFLAKNIIFGKLHGIYINQKKL